MSTLTLYMKSGNKIVQKGVKEWEVSVEGNTVTGVKVIYQSWLFRPKTRIVWSSVNLEQIEAIVCDY